MQTAIDEYIDNATHLPPVPSVLPQLMKLLNEPEIDTSKIVDVLTFEPSLTANVIQICNSALYGGSAPISDLHSAIMRLGFNQVYQFTISMFGAPALQPPQKGYGMQAGELWKHSVASAIAAQLVAKNLGEDPNVVFTAALLHDIGKIVLAETLDTQYEALISQSKNEKISLIEVEQNILGVQHAEVGGRLLARWKFPSNMVAAVRFHHHPSGEAKYQRLAAYVYIGNMIAHFMGFGYGHMALAMRGRNEAMDILKIQPEQIPQFMIHTFDKLKEIDALVDMGVQKS